MCWYFKTVATFAVVILAIMSHSRADVYLYKATFITRKILPTKYLTIQPFSIIQCAAKCYEEERQGRCSIAGYNTATKSCFLSMDSWNDAIDFPDDSFGILNTTQGISNIFLKNFDLFKIVCLK